MLKVGILGGGQLGRMLLQAAANYPVETYLLENDENAPAAHLCHHFTKGDIRNFDDVYEFGKGLDAIVQGGDGCIDHARFSRSRDRNALDTLPCAPSRRTVKSSRADPARCRIRRPSTRSDGRPRRSL